MKRISLICPICSATKFQKVPAQIIDKRNQCEKGIVAILIPEKTICPHLFVVYVDLNFSIRDVISEEGIKDLNKRKYVHVKSIDDMVSQLSKKTLNKLKDKL